MNKTLERRMKRNRSLSKWAYRFGQRASGTATKGANDTGRRLRQGKGVQKSRR